jgi:hypothetical protein
VARFLPQPLHWRGEHRKNAGIVSVLCHQSERKPDCNLDSAQIAEHIGVPEPDHPVALRLKPLRASLVSSKRFGLTMMNAIDLDDELGGVIAEICNEPTDRCLLAKLIAVPIELAQQVPQLALGRALLSPHATSPLAHQVGHAGLLPDITSRESDRPWRQ